MPFQTALSPRQRLPLARTSGLAGSIAACAVALVALGATLPASAQVDRVTADAAKVEEAYLIGPAAAAELGSSITWQARLPLSSGDRITLVDCSPVGVLAVNTRNEVTLIRPTTGDRAWLASAAERIDRVLSAEIVPVMTAAGEVDRVVVTTDTGFYALDFRDGSTVLRSRFRQVPSTRPIVVGRWLVFGTRSGQVAWFDCGTGFDTRGYTVDGPLGRSTILAQPVFGEDSIVAGSKQGTVVALDPADGRAYWRKELLGSVSAKPAIANGIAFVSSEDQYLYAFDLGSGATLWKYFTESPLTASPFPVRDLVLQQIPTEGLVAFTQNPEGSLAGEVRWKKTGLDGSPIGFMRLGGTDSVLLWCSTKRMVTAIDLRNGDVVRTVDLPKVEHLEADTIERGGLVAWSSDGRILRLSPLSNASSGR